MKSAFDEVQIGDLVLYHGTVGEVVEKVAERGGGIIIKNEAGELIAYGLQWPPHPVAKRIWILEQ